MWEFVLLIAVLIFSVYWFLNSNLKYWKKRGVPSPSASLFFGNLGPSLSLKKSVGEIYCDIYNDFPNVSYVGFYKIRTPGIVLRDPELIRNILVKEFNSFHDNDIEVSDCPATRSTFTTKGEEWKTLKNQLTPCFTSKKLKAMYPLLEVAVKRMITHLENEADIIKKDGIDAKELTSKYSTDVVASCVFGLEGKSFDEPDPEFRRMGKKIFNPSVSVIIKLLLLTMFPSLVHILKVKFISDDVLQYFRNIVHATLKYREENNVVRNDFMDFMKELRSKLGENEFNEDNIIAHALGFFTDGFETSSAVASFTLFELADNPDIQEELYLEIQETLKERGGQLDYDTLQEMPYLDAVVNEALRIHPPGMAILRACTKPFTLPPPRGAGTGPEVKLEVGTPVMTPVYAIHYDPIYYPEPQRFNPDRFSETNKALLTKGTYLPFGEGPRNCHGQRFGMMQVKLAVAYIVRNFKIEVNSKTKTPLELDPACIVPQPKGGIWLNFHKRKS